MGWLEYFGNSGGSGIFMHKFSRVLNRFLLLLLTTVVKSGYLSYCCLLVSLNQSGLCPLYQQGVFRRQNTAHRMLFFCSHTILCKLLSVFCVKTHTSAVSEVLKQSCLAPTTMPRSRLLMSLRFFPHSDFRCEH